LELLKEKNITSTQLAQALGVTQPMVSLYINGLRFPTFEAICKMTDCLNVGPDFFLAGPDDQFDLKVR
jgi:transcriptional regulator with XRE-family HTH domain